MAKILVIDDEPLLRNILRLALERAGHDVIEAPDGVAGAAILETEKIDLLVTDLIMPNQEGIETIRNARQRHPDLKIVAVSGGGHHKGPDILDHAENMGADRTFKKPFKPGEVSAAVDELLKQPA